MTRLDIICNELNAINVRLDDIERLFLNRYCEPIEVNVSKSCLLQLPDHLRKTYLALSERRRPSSATDISAITGRARANESLNLNQLERNSWVKRNKIGKTVVFSPK